MASSKALLHDLNRGIRSSKSRSFLSVALIDAEVKKLVERAYTRCKETLRNDRDLLDRITETLIEKETIDFVELYKMVGEKHPEILEAQMANFPPDMKFMEMGKEPAAEVAEVA